MDSLDISQRAARYRSLRRGFWLFLATSIATTLLQPSIAIAFFVVTVALGMGTMATRCWHCEMPVGIKRLGPYGAAVPAVRKCLNCGQALN